jgi:hypothetical protein
MNDHRTGPTIVKRVSLWWYAGLLPLILAILYGSAAGILSPWFMPLGLFAAIFWVISLIFALVALVRLRRKK